LAGKRNQSRNKLPVHQIWLEGKLDREWSDWLLEPFIFRYGPPLIGQTKMAIAMYSYLLLEYGFPANNGLNIFI